MEVVSRLRSEEDQRFVQAAGLVRHDFGLSEPPLLGLGPFELTNLEVEIAALSAKLGPYLLALLPSQGDPDQARLYCPMGIGGHRNHLSTLLAVRGAFDALRDRCTLLLYEDLHYASVPRMREVGLRRAARIFAGTRLSPIAVPVHSQDAERKMRWVSLYASQHAHAPRLMDFTPASGMASGLHEIIWQVSPSIGAQA